MSVASSPEEQPRPPHDILLLRRTDLVVWTLTDQNLFLWLHDLSKISPISSSTLSKQWPSSSSSSSWWWRAGMNGTLEQRRWNPLPASIVFYPKPKSSSSSAWSASPSFFCNHTMMMMVMMMMMMGVGVSSRLFPFRLCFAQTHNCTPPKVKVGKLFPLYSEKKKKTNFRFPGRFSSFLVSYVTRSFNTNIEIDTKKHA